MSNESKQEIPKGEDRQKFLLQKLEDLAADLITDPVKLRAFAEAWNAGLHRYSFSNQLLIAFQGGSLCAGFHSWKKKQRHVKKGSSAIWILAPRMVRIASKEAIEGTEEKEEDKTFILKGFLSVPVFDIKATEGKPLELGNSMVKGHCDLSLKALAAKFDVPMEINESLSDGSTNGQKIWISNRENPAQMKAAYFHELAHVMLHHGESKRELNREIRELEAEATSYIACACLGIDNEGAKYYIAHWNGDREKVKKSALKIISTAEKIIKRIQGDK